MSNDDSPTESEPDRPPDLAGLGEDRLVQRIRQAANSADARVIKGIGDDAAVVTCKDKTVVTTEDDDK